MSTFNYVVSGASIRVSDDVTVNTGEEIPMTDEQVLEAQLVQKGLAVRKESPAKPAAKQLSSKGSGKATKDS